MVIMLKKEVQEEKHFICVDDNLRLLLSSMRARRNDTTVIFSLQ